MKISIPEFPSHCQECGRLLDARLQNPYGAWAIPVSWIKGDRRIVTCGFCHTGVTEMARLPEGCLALEQLKRYLLTPARLAQ